MQAVRSGVCVANASATFREAEEPHDLSFPVCEYMPATLHELQLHIGRHAQVPQYISLLDTTKEYPDIVARYRDIDVRQDRDIEQGKVVYEEQGKHLYEEQGNVVIDEQGNITIVKEGEDPDIVNEDRAGGAGLGSDSR